MKRFSIFFLGVFVFISCSSFRASKQVKEYTINGDIQEILHYENSDTLISKIKMNIDGYCNGECSFIYKHSPYNDGRKIMLSGKVSLLIEHDWYDNDVMIEFHPEANFQGGKIKIAYRVY